jgi:uncharacterized protein YbaR (Trm112 family)
MKVQLLTKSFSPMHRMVLNSFCTMQLTGLLCALNSFCTSHLEHYAKAVTCLEALISNSSLTLEKMNTDSKLTNKEDLICLICMDVPVEAPVITPCGHFFCQECIHEWCVLESKECCPMDRQPLTYDQMKEVDKDGSVWKTWSELTVECKGHDLGCHWNGLAKDHLEHIRSCPYGTAQYVYDYIKRRHKNTSMVRSRVREMIGVYKYRLESNRLKPEYRLVCVEELEKRSVELRKLD